jgi:hypothetical protein
VWGLRRGSDVNDQRGDLRVLDEQNWTMLGVERDALRLTSSRDSDEMFKKDH